LVIDYIIIEAGAIARIVLCYHHVREPLAIPASMLATL